MTARQKDVLLGLIATTAFSAIYLYIIPVQVPVQSPVQIPALSPDFWPKNITLFIILLGVWQTLYSIFRKYPDEAADDRTHADNLKDLLLGVLLVAYCLAAPVMGMLLASGLAMLCCMLLFGERKPLPLLFYSMVVPLCMHLFLVKIARILIPQGWLPI